VNEQIGKHQKCSQTAFILFFNHNFLNVPFGNNAHSSVSVCIFILYLQEFLLETFVQEMQVVITAVRVEWLRELYYTVSQKNKTPYSCPQVRQMLTDFQNCFTVRLCSKFVIKLYINIPPCLKHFATLPCEISMFKKSPCSRSY